jgi:hypothetical protein
VPGADRHPDDLVAVDHGVVADAADHDESIAGLVRAPLEDAELRTVEEVDPAVDLPVGEPGVDHPGVLREQARDARHEAAHPQLRVGDARGGHLLRVARGRGSADGHREVGVLGAAHQERHADEPPGRRQIEEKVLHDAPRERPPREV